MNEWSYSGDERKPRKRTGVIVQAGIFGPLFLVTAAGFIFAVLQIMGGDYGYVVMLTISGLFAVILGFQALHYLKDISASPVVSEGEVGKKWTKANLFFFFVPSYYIAVKGKIYSIPRDDYAGLLEGDLVRVEHFPNTLTVESLERYDEQAERFVPAASGASSY
jgi:hypothetical protein